jgi:hypothetical protein
MTEQQPEAPALEQVLTEAVDRFREDLLYTAPEFHGERWRQFLARMRDIAEDFYRKAETNAGAPVATSPASVPAETATASTAPPAAPPVAAALDREGLHEIVVAAGKPLGGLGRATAWEITDAIWPLLEHAQAAAAGSHEGVRLWMADCGELVAKHRARAEAAEGKLRAIDQAVTRFFTETPHGGWPEDLADAVRAVIGSEEGADRG